MHKRGEEEEDGRINDIMVCRSFDHRDASLNVS